ncbi:MAG: hypothetical protein ACI3XW_06055 [Butyricicoccus sp.]
MEVIKNAAHKKMVTAMQAEAVKTFSVCSPEQCPPCRISDG